MSLIVYVDGVNLDALTPASYLYTLHYARKVKMKRTVFGAFVFPFQIFRKRLLTHGFSRTV